MSKITPATEATFGANLRRARQAAGLTLRQVAARIRIKTIAPLSMLERSAKVPEPKTILKLAAAVGTSPAALLRNVVTPYDALRAHRPRVDAALAYLPGVLSEREREMLDAWRAADPRLQRLVQTILRELGGAFEQRSSAARAQREQRSRAGARPRAAGAASANGTVPAPVRERDRAEATSGRQRRA